VLRQILQQFSISGRLQCVLSAIGEPALLFVQILSDNTTFYSQPVANNGNAAAVRFNLSEVVRLKMLHHSL
jgi:hypothetical protein